MIIQIRLTLCLLILIYFAIKNTELTRIYHYYVVFNLDGCRRSGTGVYVISSKINSINVVREIEQTLSEDHDGEASIVNYILLKKTYKINWKTYESS